MSRILRLQRLSISQEHSMALVESSYSIHCGGMEPSELSIHCTTDL